MKHRPRRAAAMSVAITMLAGCGTSPRDAFFRARSIAIKPTSGDHSRISMAWLAPKQEPDAVITMAPDDR